MKATKLDTGISSENAMLNTTLKTELGALSALEKLEVFEMIRSTVMPMSDDSFSELSASQQAELLRRSEQAAANPGAGRTWAEVKQSLGH